MATKPKVAALSRVYRPGAVFNLNRAKRVGRMAAQIMVAVAQDKGGSDQISTAQSMLIEHGTWLHLRMREIEEAYADGKPLDSKEFAMLANSLVAVLTRLGLGRVAKSAGSLQQLLEQEEAQPSA